MHDYFFCFPSHGHISTYTHGVFLLFQVPVFSNIKYLKKQKQTNKQTNKNKKTALVALRLSPQLTFKLPVNNLAIFHHGKMSEIGDSIHTNSRNCKVKEGEIRVTGQLPSDYRLGCFSDGYVSSYRSWRNSRVYIGRPAFCLQLLTVLSCLCQRFEDRAIRVRGDAGSNPFSSSNFVSRLLTHRVMVSVLCFSGYVNIK